jgi:hypothetical protein
MFIDHLKDYGRNPITTKRHFKLFISVAFTAELEWITPKKGDYHFVLVISLQQMAKTTRHYRL